MHYFRGNKTLGGISRQRLISPGQALLILLSGVYKDDKEHYVKLKKLYLLGSTAQNTAVFSEYLNHPELKEYKISTEPEIINDDASRRYFETHLAFETTKNTLINLNFSDLDAYVESIKALRESIRQAKDLYREMGSHESNEQRWRQVLEVTSVKDILKLDENEREFADFIYRLNNKEIFGNLTEENRNKIKKIVAAIYIGIDLAKTVTYLQSENSDDDRFRDLLPLNVYDSGLFSYENRGIQTKNEQKKISSNAYGILRAHAPLQQDDAAYTQRPFTYLKPSEKSSPNNNALWARNNNKQLVHPFSNSISGTLLGQLRVLKALDDKHSALLDQKSFFKVFISVMLGYSGGHTLNEFTAVFNEVAALTYSGYDFKKFNLESLFWTDNQDALEIAFQKTIKYNDGLLKRTQLNKEIKNFKSEQLKPPSPKEILSSALEPTKKEPEDVGVVQQQSSTQLPKKPSHSFNVSPAAKESKALKPIYEATTEVERCSRTGDLKLGRIFLSYCNHSISGTDNSLLVSLKDKIQKVSNLSIVDVADRRDCYSVRLSTSILETPEEVQKTISAIRQELSENAEEISIATGLITTITKLTSYNVPTDQKNDEPEGVGNSLAHTPISRAPSSNLRLKILCGVGAMALGAALIRVAFVELNVATAGTIAGISLAAAGGVLFFGGISGLGATACCNRSNNYKNLDPSI